MIYGVGTDVVEIRRIELALERHGGRFARRILHSLELETFDLHRLPGAFLARRFAAKEAFGKALGSGIRAPATWHALWVQHDLQGRPQFGFDAPLRKRMALLRIARSHLSISDERSIATATVVLECDD
jgi:holo-[acyl-carrier protein] synthase